MHSNPKQYAHAKTKKQIELYRLKKPTHRKKQKSENLPGGGGVDMLVDCIRK